MITIASFSKPENAHLLRMRLEAGGVTAYILDENTVQMDWLISNAIGGVRVQIAEEDIENAREILSEVLPVAPSNDHPICPSCASKNTAPHELPHRLSFLSLGLIGFPLLFAKHQWKCADCGKTWDETPAEEL